MAQIPYNPIPTVAPSSAPTPEVQVNAPAEAFGGTVGQAISGLGKSVEGAGDELFKRALALQQVRNEADAREADANYIEASGKLHVEYQSKQGKDAIDGLPDYIKSQKELRLSMRDGLGNDTSRKLFDAQTQQTLGRTIFNAAGHAATETRKYAAGTAQAQMDVDAQAVTADPTNPQLFDQTLAKTKNNVRTITDIQGLAPDSPQAQEADNVATSKLWSQRILGLSRTAPFEAAKMLDANKGALTPDDYLKVDNSVRSQSRAVGSVNIANEVYTAGRGDDDKPGKSLSEMEAEARAKAKAQDPADPLLESHAVTALRGQWNQDKYAKKQEDYANLETVNGAISNGVTDIQALRSDPKVAAAIDALPKDKQLAIPARINSYNAAKDKVANEGKFNTLMGLANNDVEAFLNTDPYATGLNQSQMNQIASKQQKLKASQAQDPRVDRAMGWMRTSMGAQMEALGVFKRTTGNKDDYDHLTGTVQSALDLWQENHSKPPTYKEFNEQIAPQVIAQRSEPGTLYGTNQKPFYTQTVPDKFSEELKSDVIAKGGVEPTEQQIYKAYIRTQLMKLYPTAKKSNE